MKKTSCLNFLEKNKPAYFSAVINGVYYSSKYGAKRMGRDFELSKEEVANMITSPCVYCGVIGGREVATGQFRQHTWQVNGIDRIDNALGYVHGNVAPCCERCNKFKHVLSVEDFLNHVKRIYEFQNQKEMVK